MKVCEPSFLKFPSHKLAPNVEARAHSEVLRKKEFTIPPKRKAAVKMNVDTRARSRNPTTNINISDHAVETLGHAIEVLSRVMRSPVNQNIPPKNTAESNRELPPLNALEKRIIELETRISQQDTRYRQVESRIQNFETKFQKVIEKQDSLEQPQIISELRKEIAIELAQIRTEVEKLNRMPRESSPYPLERQRPLLQRDMPPTDESHQVQLMENIRENRPFAIKPRVPTFSGKAHEHPPKYIRELDRFIRTTQIPGNQLHMILDQSLLGIAHEWWDLSTSEIQNWQDFERKFLSRFWSTSIQQRFRITLEQGSFKEGSGMTRVNYAMKLIANARDLTPIRSDEEIVLVISRHFSQIIADSVIAQNINSIEAFLALLDRWDNNQKVNRPSNDSQTTINRSFSKSYQGPTTSPIAKTNSQPQRTSTPTFQRPPTNQGHQSHPIRNQPYHLRTTDVEEEQQQEEEVSTLEEQGNE